MRMFRSLVVIIVAAITSQAGFAADLTHASVPPDVLLQLEGHTLPPIADLASSGLIPGRYADAKSTVSEMGFITQWLGHYNMLLGFLDDDLVGESGIGAICYANRLTEHDDAPIMYRYYWSYPQIWTGHYNAFEDREACETVYIQWSSNGSGAYYRFFASVVDNHTSDPVDVGPGTYVYPPPLQ